MMKEILVFVLFSGLLFFGFVVMLIMAFVRKKKSFAIISFLLLLLCIGSVSRQGVTCLTQLNWMENPSTGYQQNADGWRFPAKN